MDVSKTIWNKSSLVIITGASRGIGAHAAVRFGQEISPNSTIVLIARDKDGLCDTKSKINEISDQLNVLICELDLGKSNLDDFTKALSPLRDLKHELVIMMHNAGSVICNTLATEMTDYSQWNNYMNLNLYSVAALTSAFMSLPFGKKYIVNVSSLCAVKPMKGLGFYCVGKAARDMFFKTFAIENPQVVVLSYSPGPIETDMYITICKDAKDESVREMFQSMKKESKLVKIEDTISKLIRVLDGDFTSGSHIDFYDRIA